MWHVFGHTLFVIRSGYPHSCRDVYWNYGMFILTVVAADGGRELIWNSILYSFLSYNFHFNSGINEMTERMERRSKGATPGKAPLRAPGVTLGFLWGSVLGIPSPVKN